MNAAGLRNGREQIGTDGEVALVEAKKFYFDPDQSRGHILS
jgi:hypothetical protein